MIVVPPTAAVLDAGTVIARHAGIYIYLGCGKWRFHFYAGQCASRKPERESITCAPLDAASPKL
jgi:hypothetical protein